MFTYLLDASAAVNFYALQHAKANRALKHIRDQKLKYRQASLFIPNFCIAEVFNALAKMHFNPDHTSRTLDSRSYKNALKEFRDDVHWGRVLYPYDLNRYHVIASDIIIPVEHNLALKDNRGHLSTYDILVIAMACELGYSGNPDEVYLLTCDNRMKRVFEEIKRSDPSQWMIPGPLGELDTRRWEPPNCIDLLNIERGALPSAIDQPRYT
jgi:hypothetical protein